MLCNVDFHSGKKSNNNNEQRQPIHNDVRVRLLWRDINSNKVKKIDTDLDTTASIIICPTNIEEKGR